MSTARNAAIDRAADTIKHFDTTQDPIRNIAIAVVNTLNPQIFDAKQMIGVPKGSILITARTDVLVYQFDGFDLHLLKVGGSGGSFNPYYIIKDWGPLTVVWMP
jgi:hypothetical protein